MEEGGGLPLATLPVLSQCGNRAAPARALSLIFRVLIKGTINCLAQEHHDHIRSQNRAWMEVGGGGVQRRGGSFIIPFDQRCSKAKKKKKKRTRKNYLPFMGVEGKREGGGV